MYITPCLLLYLKEVIKVVQKYVQISAFTKWKGPLIYYYLILDVKVWNFLPVLEMDYVQLFEEFECYYKTVYG